MLSARCSLLQPLRLHARTCISRRDALRRTRRHLSTSSTATPPSAPPHASSTPGLAAFGSLTSELDRIAPRFEIDASDIEILKEPAEFYAVLKAKIANAKRRIYISTLYVGKTEHELIATIEDALTRNADLKISFLTDALRGTRESPDLSCASLLAPLVAKCGADRVRVRMFHTPNLVGLRKAVLPKRINEGWGLQHMKLYGIDDAIIMSGANLSSDYFTNRLDRYHVLQSAALTDFYERVHDAVSRLSFDVMPDQRQPDRFRLAWPRDDAGCASPLDDAAAYIRHASAQLAPLIKPPATQAAARPSATTVVYPLFQLAPLLPAPDTKTPAPSTELPALRLLLHRLSTAPFAPARWSFTAGYFNMTPAVRDMLLSSLLHSPSARGTVLTAHPHANGFFGSSGVSGLLPPAYTLLARRFWAHAARAGVGPRLQLREWRRGVVGQDGAWTYHAKGLWVWLPDVMAPSKGGESRDDGGEGDGDKGPALTLVGSSNYTARSHELDLEANALLLTADAGLRGRLGAEEARLMAHAGAPVDAETFAAPERRVGWRVRVALWIVGVVGGAL